jgi:hypothetical protein
MSQTIKIKNSVTSSNTPTTSNLTYGELAVNHADNKLFAVHTTAGSITSVVDVVQAGITAHESNVNVTGGAINNTPIGATTPQTGSFSSLNASLPIVSSDTTETTSSSTGSVRLEGGLLVKKSARVLGNLTVGGTITGNVTVTTASLTGGTIDGVPIGQTTQAAVASTGLTASGSVTFNSNVQSTSTTTGTLKVVGGAGITQNLNVGGSISTANLVATGGAINNTTIGATTPNTGAFTSLTASGNITGQAIIQSAGSTDATSGAGASGMIMTYGGASIAKKVYVGTDLTVGGNFYESIETISAAGTTQSTAQLIAKTVTNVTSVGSGAGIRLPVPAIAGAVHYIINNGANPLKVYPATSAAIDGNAQNAAVIIPIGQNVGLVADTTASWYSFIDATTAGSSNNIVVSHPAAGLTIDLANTVVLSGNITSANFSGNHSGTHSGASSGTNTGDQDLSGLVTKITTVNGHALSGNISITASDVGAQPTLTAGTNITITGNTISASGGGGGTTYTAGTDISLAGNVISFTGNVYNPTNVAITGGNVSIESLTTSVDATINGLTVGHGLNNQATSVAVGPAVLANTTTGETNNGLGNRVLNQTTTGGDNTAMGDNTMYSNTSGNYNAAFGASALFSNTTGNLNCAFGEFAGNTSSTGDSNTFIGAMSGENVTTGSNNTCLGYNTNPLNVTDSNSIVIGHGLNGLGANTTVVGSNAGRGQFNGVDINTGDWRPYSSSEAVIIGQKSGTNLLYAANYTSFGANVGNAMTWSGTCTYLGSQVAANSTQGSAVTAGSFLVGSGYVIITTGTTSFTSIGAANNNPGSRFVATGVGSGTGTAQPCQIGNTGIGYQTLKSITTGTRNHAIGNPALPTLTSGYNNVAIGYNALNGLTTGRNNVAIGHSANGTGGENCVIIGANAVTGDTGNNQIVIGGVSSGQNAGFGSNTTVIGTSFTTNHKIYGAEICDYQYLTPIDGDTLTIDPTKTVLVVDTAGDVAALTLVLPDLAIPGQVLRISSTWAVASLTITTGAGLGNGQPTSLYAGQCVSWINVNEVNAWYILSR